MTGLHVTPDKKMGYTVITNGTAGAISAARSGGSIMAPAASPRPPRFPAGRASVSECRPDGKKLYMYGAGFEIDVYDAGHFPA